MNYPDFIQNIVATQSERLKPVISFINYILLNYPK